MRREFQLRHHPGGKVIPGAMNRPTKHDQDGNGNVEWWDSWRKYWLTAPYDSCKHGDRYCKWRHTTDYLERNQ